ncbi:MAG: GIY-YIG nuclease family protein [Hyphomicrobium sp.]|nr:GIY-YIG nuclease family protein [Hyphomicrobium sp.]
MACSPVERRRRLPDSDTETGHLYVGSASGAGGLWQRWSDYAATGHRGNVELKAIINGLSLDRAKPFRISILEIADIQTGDADVLAREAHWKRVLLSRSHGLNGN